MSMEQIQQELKHLCRSSLSGFISVIQTVGSDFERTYQDMRQLQITAGKIVKRFEEIQEVQLDKRRIAQHNPRSQNGMKKRMTD